MSLLQPSFLARVSSSPTVFTFHNVSITTEVLEHVHVSSQNLHSTMSLLQRLRTSSLQGSIRNLHSTMSLLQLKLSYFSPVQTLFTFHNVSITTICIQKQTAATGNLFTFHNVSITTELQFEGMYLSLKFTFHNVSITTKICVTVQEFSGDLHSTMSLLQQKIESALKEALYIFTFHNVSITTKCSHTG